MSEIEQLARLLATRCEQKGVRISCAESCTGGMIAAALTAVSGASAWFDTGFVTYTVEAKKTLLGVQPETLERCGVVSEEVAREMAVGAIAHSEATLSVGVTGVAGPTGGSEKTPVGTVCFGFAFKTPQAVCAESSRQCFAGDREAVREESVRFALRTLTQILA